MLLGQRRSFTNPSPYSLKSKAFFPDYIVETAIFAILYKIVRVTTSPWYLRFHLGDLKAAEKALESGMSLDDYVKQTQKGNEMLGGFAFADEGEEDDATFAKGCAESEREQSTSGLWKVPQ